MLSVSYDFLLVVERHLVLWESISKCSVAANALSGLTHADIDLVKGTRAAAVRNGTDEVAALARGLNVRASGAMIVDV